MRALLSVVIASAIIAAPATAQEANIAGPDENIATEATNDAVTNGLTGGPDTAEPPAVPPVFEDPEVADATVTPDSNGGGVLPWGLLGLLGLIGLLGRNR